MFHKGEHEKQFAYTVHTACDAKGFILATMSTPAKTHDSIAFYPLYDQLKLRFKQMQYVVMDAGYKTAAICKKVFDNNKYLYSLTNAHLVKRDSSSPEILFMMNIMIV